MIASYSLDRSKRNETIAANVVILAAFALRVWALDVKGFAYDEAATALMARATIPEIVRFHWVAAFEHLPLWVLLMRGWSQLAAQSEFALRYVSVLSGLAVIPLIFALLRKLEQADVAWRLLTIIFVAFSPVLLFYAQEARMYSLVLALAIATLIATISYLNGRAQYGRWLLPGVIVINWVMLALHYYSVMLLISIGLYLVTVLFAAQDRTTRRRSVFALIALALSVIPLAWWMVNSPGFQSTFAAVLGAKSVTSITANWFLTDLWQDASFGSIRWRPGQSWTGFLLLPVILCGVFASYWSNLHRNVRQAIYLRVWPLLFTLIVALPLIISAIAFRTLAIRYILYIMPFAYAFAAFGTVWLWRWQRLAGALAAALVLVVSVTGITHYFGPYTKSEYREAAAYVLERYQPGQDSIFLESPRQHLMARYYFGPDFLLQPIPPIELPEYWPVNAPPVVPEDVDDVVQQHLQDANTLCVMLSAEPEVDRGEFLSKYLTAVAYKDDCKQWLDVRVCRYQSPRAVDYLFEAPIDVVYGDELALHTVHLGSLDDEVRDSATPLRMQFDWKAVTAPSVNYTLSVKVIDEQGAVRAQADQLPIGQLLPPTTWMAGDEKPGYVVVELTVDLEPGEYSIVSSVYDPQSLEPTPYRSGDGQTSTKPHHIAKLVVGEDVMLLPVNGGE